MSIRHFFTDPILQAPTIASMLMCLSCAMIGTIIVLRKRSLMGEVLSHASYPGVAFAALSVAMLPLPLNDFWMSTVTLLSSFIFAILGYYLIEKLENKYKVYPDSALTFVLAISLGIGVLFASILQSYHPISYRRALTFLYGQAATMTDIHIYIYLAISIFTTALIIMMYGKLKLALFDRSYAKTQGMNIQKMDKLILYFVCFAVIVGIRSVGVILMAGMIIAPAVAAKAFTNRLSILFVLSAFIGIISAFFGNVLAANGSFLLHDKFPDSRISLPTGPMILLTGFTICVLSLLFAPKTGFIYRFLRKIHFHYRCKMENLLKAIWKYQKQKPLTWKEIHRLQPSSKWVFLFLFVKLLHRKFISYKENGYFLTTKGSAAAEKIIRLHRLWELYLFSYLGYAKNQVHPLAEEMEHILTPEIERELTTFLDDPKKDPHCQPIPQYRSLT